MPIEEMDVPTKANGVEGVEKEVVESTPEIAPEVESLQTASEDGGTQTSSGQEEVETRPTLESVWESLQASKSLEPDEKPIEAPPEAQAIPESQPIKVRPSSLRTRPRTGAKRNVTFKDDVQKVEEMEVHRPGARKPSSKSHRRPKVPPGCLGLLLSVALASLIVYIASPNVPTKPRMWTSAELAKFNGTDNKPPLLLGIMGSVFDVSKGWKHYGPGGSYHHFVGRDASRAFVSGNFTGDGLTDSLEGLTPSQIKAIDDWRLFFVSRYVYLGKLVGTYYNKEGLPTKMLHLAEKKVKQAAKIEKQQLVDEERFPNCNSRWTQDKGGEVWCNDGQVPRITELITEGPRRGPPRTRCACLEPDELQRPGLKSYEGCDPQSSKCIT